jgi:AraC-like DNA-binding protein
MPGTVQFSATTKDRATFQIARSTYRVLRLAFKNLADEFHGNAEFRCDMVRSQITALLIRLHRLCLSTPSVEVQGYSTQLTNRFLSLLEKEEGKLQRTRYYTSALSVSPRVLVDAVLTETGKSPSAWIRDRTLLEARRLLIYTDLTISEIAYRLNFRNVSYFVRFYRRLAGVSPEPRAECKCKEFVSSLLASLHAGRGKVGRVAEIFPLLASLYLRQVILLCGIVSIASENDAQRRLLSRANFL